MADRLLTYEECLAWAERYGYTSLSTLALSTAADKQPGPIKVMRSLFALVRVEREAREAAEKERDEARDVA